MKKADAKKKSPRLPRRGAQARRRAFTLIEIMIVVAIIGLIAAMGIPSMLQMLKKDGMRQAVSDVTDLLGNVRADAILKGKTDDVTFHPADNRLDSSIGKSVTLPDGVAMEGIGINLKDFSETEESHVFFFPNGTCDEMTLVLHSGADWRKITLEFSTSIATAEPLIK
jgi:prepilin-type N-terminal cleavage/methylation domain-containing protein